MYELVKHICACLCVDPYIAKNRIARSGCQKKSTDVSESKPWNMTRLLPLWAEDAPFFGS